VKIVIFFRTLVLGLFVANASTFLYGATCPADLLLRNGHIVTMDDARRVVSSVAIKYGKIVVVGTEKDTATCKGPSTRTFDLHGQTVIPGLIDVHTHAMDWAEGIVRGDIDVTYPNVHSIHDIVQSVRDRVAAARPGAWIQGAGWDDSKLSEKRYLNKADLDEVSPQNPVYLEHRSGHIGIANSMALRLAKIKQDTPNPQGGVIEKDGMGEPTGLLRDKASNLVIGLLPATTSDERIRAAKLVSEKAAELGLTTIHDVWGGSIPLFPEDMQAYQEAANRGWLKIRVQMCPGVANVVQAEQLAKSGLHTGFGNDHLKLGAVKFFADGGISSITAALYPPAAEGLAQDNLGITMWKPEDMQKAQLILAEAGWQLEAHAQGDRGMDEVLDSYAAVMKELKLTEPRFRIVHGGLSTPAIQQRLRTLHVLVDSNPSFIYWVGAFFPRYGPERLRWIYPLKSYFDGGITAGAGSDAPVTPLSPWWGLWAAVARQELTTGNVLIPEERITILQALQMYTRNGAYTGFEEKEKGSLEPGKLADFLVIDRDVLSVPANEIKDVQVLKTFVGGELVYERR
jgi:predicted amidohydrolase YtcJ